MNTNRLAGVKSRGACHTQSPLPISSKHVPSFRKQLVNPYSSRITVPRICSSRECLVMTRRKKNPKHLPNRLLWKAAFSSKREGSRRGRSTPGFTTPTRFSWLMAPIPSTLDQMKVVKKVSWSPKQQQCFLQPFLPFLAMENGYLQARGCVCNSISRLFLDKYLCGLSALFLH